MSVVYDVEGIVIGDRAKLETIAEQYLNDPEAKEMNYSLEAKINDEGNLVFTGQGVGRNMTAPEVEKIIDKYLDDDVECYKLWGSTDGCWDQFTNDTEGKYYKQWYVDDYTHKLFFDSYEEAKTYAMQIIKNNPQYVQGLEESGKDEEEYFDEVDLEYLVLNEAPVQIVNTRRVVEEVRPSDNDANALFVTGNNYYFGHGVAKDLKLSAEYYEKAALLGHPGAQFNLGNAYYNGHGVQQNYEIAVKWYQKAAEQGEINAQNSLGNAYYIGRGVQQDYELAVKWYEKAARMENVLAQNNLGIAYFYGRGVQQNYEKAFEWFEESARMDNPSAQCNVAECYENGYGVEKDLVQAVKWYKESAENGYEPAQQWLDSHPEEIKEANQLEYEAELRERAEVFFGIAKQEFNEGNPANDEDCKEAYELFSDSARDGYAESMAYLGVMYRNGFVVEKDDAKAAEWYQKAIDTGGDTLLTSMAYNNLGILYLNGQGVERNLQKAKELFELAVAKDNNEQAQQHLDEINKKMTSGHTDSNLIEEFARSNNARVLVKRITNREEAVRAFGRLAKAYRVGCHSLDFIGLTCGDLAGKLTSLQENDILLAFNLKSADPLVLDYLKGAVNNFKIVITLSPDPNSQGIEIDLRPFTMVICE